MQSLLSCLQPSVYRFVTLVGRSLLPPPVIPCMLLGSFSLHVFLSFLSTLIPNYPLWCFFSHTFLDCNGSCHPEGHDGELWGREATFLAVQNPSRASDRTCCCLTRQIVFLYLLASFTKCLKKI